MSEQTLNRSLRPQRLSDLYGQEALIKSIRSHMKNRPPQAWMLTGGSGCGKTTVARIIALGLQCTHSKPGLWGDACAACLAHSNSFAIHELNASDVNGVDDIRQFVEMSKSRPVNSAYRIFILDEFHRVTSAAQNVLLKPTEDPPPYAIWIIATTEPSKVLPTLRRRFVTYNLKPLSPDKLLAFVTKSAAAGEIARPLTPLVTALNNAEVYSPGFILNALEKYSAGAEAAESVSNVDGTTVDTYSICKAVTAGNWRAIAATYKDTAPEHSRWIQASVSGWLKGCLMRESGPRGERLALSLIEINGPSPLDDARLHHWLFGVLYKICRRFGA